MPTECVAALAVPVRLARCCFQERGCSAANPTQFWRGRVRRSSRARRDVNYSEDAVQGAGGDIARMPPVSSIAVHNARPSETPNIADSLQKFVRALLPGR